MSQVPNGQAESSPQNSPTQSLGATILASIQSQIGSAWASWPLADQELAIACCSDAAALAIQVAATPAANAAELAALQDEKNQIDAQLANLQAAAAMDVSGIVWGAVEAALSFAEDFAIKAVEK